MNICRGVGHKFFAGSLVAWVFSATLLHGADLKELPPAATRPIDFVKDVQPIFEGRCYDCHGAQKQEAGFRLDQRAGAMKGGEYGEAILPGKSDQSLIILALAGQSEMVARMPKKGDALSQEQIGILRAWIDQGAKWPETTNVQAKDPKKHWAFHPPQRPSAPSVKNRKWLRNDIDGYVLARLEKEGLQPSPEAGRAALARRLSLDLLGLPPSTEELDVFLADKSPKAYETYVDKLLQSPHYGERWGRHWLDAARYADSDGFEKDKSRAVWFYRDWVVNAFNRDLPYDQFVIQQIAGDSLPQATQDQMVATGFLRNSMINEEGGVDPEQFRMDAMFDRMDAIGKSVLGLTIQCAQCHTHKYDPLTQEEYYRLFAFLNNDHEAQRITYTPAEQMKAADLSRQIRELEEGLRHTSAGWEERMAKWEDEAKKNQSEWVIINPRVLEDSDSGQKYLIQKDGSFLAQGYAPTHHTPQMLLTNDLKGITGFRLELMTDPNLPAGGPGRSFMGTSALTEFVVDITSVANPTNKATIKFASATADYSNPERDLEPNFDDRSNKHRVTGPVAFAIDGKEETAWGIDAGVGRRNVPRKAVFTAAEPAGYEGGTIWNIKLKQNHGGWNSDDHMNNNLGRFRLSVTTNTSPSADPLPKNVRDILAIPREQRGPNQQSAIFSYWRSTQADFKESNDKIDALWAQWPAGSTSLTLLARDEMRKTSMLRRGDWLKPGKEVAAGVPAFLNPLPEGSDGSRLSFGKWLVDRKSPTTARVMMNRLWQGYFGTGIVGTSEDFGMQSETPTHPELLDWMAVEFMDRGWSLKQMHRLIVTSATYRQSSKVTPELYAKDPNNRLLARGPRFRVEGEIVRDIALASSGLLNEKVGGPAVFSPAPEFLFMPPASYAPFTWKEEKGENRYRRALYTFRRRSTPYPMLQTYDVPNGDSSCVRRLRSNTPLQALTSLNETVFMESAQALAALTLKSGGSTDEARIQYAFRRVLGRVPSSDERKVLLQLLQKQMDRLREGWIDSVGLATGKDEVPKVPQGTTPNQLAAYTVVSRVLLNLDETITKE